MYYAYPNAASLARADLMKSDGSICGAEGMDYTILGKTGLKVSVAGLGCGGNSRLGQGTGKSAEESIGIVRKAVELGVNCIDTAANYRTEGIVGEAIEPFLRDSLVVATKATVREAGKLAPVERIVESLEASLRALRTDYIDVFQLHAVPPALYDRVVDEFAPTLLREKEKGKFRHLGVTETAPNDPGHEMLARAVHDDCWEVMMLGHHMMHQGARETVFPYTIEKQIGTLMMFVVRNIFSQKNYLRRTLSELARAGDIPAELAGEEDPLGFLVRDGGAAGLTDAAYRYVRHEPGADVVLFGTGDPDHLATNISSILKPPLPTEDVERLNALFGKLQGVGLDLPDRSENR